jgi:dihydroorotase-like cyclic amidohydrolase
VAHTAPFDLGQSFDLGIRNGRVIDSKADFDQVAPLEIEDCNIVSIAENDIIAHSRS